MVTPLPRRRVLKLARETATLDRLCDGRLILGLGTGGDRGREYSAFGEPIDARRWGRMLDEGTTVLTELWAGKTVSHRGEIGVDAVRAIPGPVQQPRIPIWFGTERASGRPIERAARYDGIFPIGVDADGVKRIRDRVADVRGDLAGFDIAVVSERGTDLDSLRAAGATWAMHGFWPGHTAEQVLRFIDRGVPAD